MTNEEIQQAIDSCVDALKASLLDPQKRIYIENHYLDLIEIQSTRSKLFFPKSDA